MSASPVEISPPASSRTQPSAREFASRQLAFGALLALVLLCLAWELWLAPTGRGTLAIKALPLALALPGLWRYRMYTFRWLSLLVWLYITEGALRIVGADPLNAALAGLEIVLGTVVFGACAWHIRLRLAAAKAARTGQPGEGAQR
jgi:uncharacterized membrane protein